MTDDKISKFCGMIAESFAKERFAKAVLSAPRDKGSLLQKILIRETVIKGVRKLSFTYRYKTRDEVKNYGPDEAETLIAAALEKEFKSANLFTLDFDCAYPAMKKTKASVQDKPDTAHDRTKNRIVKTDGKFYLHALGITDENGNVLKTAQDKYKQIDKYVEIVSALFKDLAKDKEIRIADMGAGKGYLTFALYDYLSTEGWSVSMTGVEYRADLVTLCNKIAKEAGFTGLGFVEGIIGSYNAPLDVLIALHACDTATDDAIAAGVKAGAKIIVVAPCCHKQIRKEMEKGTGSKNLSPILRHGIFMERTAEMVTDSIRALALEHAGYAVKVFEFISDEHTPKNAMITAVKAKQGRKNKDALSGIKTLKGVFGIENHFIEQALGLNNVE